jgi:pimeloyl-ACP methyl ester carboxylesterase
VGLLDALQVDNAVLVGHDWGWADLGHSVATGQPSFERQFGMPLFDYYQRAPEAPPASMPR